MNYKPGKDTLIAYLYGELSQEEKNKVEGYLSENPTAQREVAELQNTLKVLGKLPDLEVTPPTFVFNRDKVVVVEHGNTRIPMLKIVMGIAASILIVMLVGYFTHFRITYSNQSLSIGYGEAAMPSNQPANTVDIDQLVQQAIAKNNKDVLGRMEDMNNHFNAELASQSRERASTINTLLERTKEMNDNVIQMYVSQMRDENRRVIENLFSLSNAQQQRVMNDVLTDFSQYLENQRQSDLRLIQASFNGLKDNTETNLQETNQILASIITTVNNQNY
ncbi:MAG TPA: hypothetical protein VIS49_03175 [Cyclobacteriaceae bacterium]